MLDVYEELTAIARVLDEAQVPYALIGGLAVSVYARPRATEDIDLLLSPQDLEHAAERLGHLGYQLLPSVFQFPRSSLTMRRFTRLAQDDFMVLDVILASSPQLEDMLQRRVAAEHAGGRLWLVPLDGLRHLKQLRGSPQDLADLAALGAEEEEEP